MLQVHGHGYLCILDMDLQHEHVQLDGNLHGMNIGIDGDIMDLDKKMDMDMDLQ